MWIPKNDCNHTSTEVTRQAALALGTPGVICLALSIVGLVAELVFVCKKKNNFLLRLFIYMTVAVTITHAVYTSYWLIYFDPENGQLCAWIEALMYYPSMVEFLFIISINCILLHKVYTSVQTSCYHCHGSKAIEVIFVVVHFIIPLIIVGVLLWIAGDPKYWPPSNVCHFNYTIGAECNRRLQFELLFKIIPEYIPVAIELPLSILCICTLSVWLCWLLRKQFLRARIKTILKETGLLLGYLSSYCIIRIVIEVMRSKNPSLNIIILFLYPINRATIPLSFIIYVYFVYLCPPRSDQNTNPPTDQHTHPPSTRVSLPSNTADRALNFLSKSELISSSHKNSKRAPTEETALLN